MLKVIIYFMLGLNCLFYLLLFTEINSLPSFYHTMKALSNYSHFLTLCLIVLSLGYLPLMGITLILSNLKKYIFIYSKDLKYSYYNAIKCLTASYLTVSLIEKMYFLIQLAFSPNYYEKMRMSEYYLSDYSVYEPSISVLIALIFQSTSFIAVFLVAELCITYKLSVTTIEISSFLLKNIKLIIAISFIIFYNQLIILYFEDNVYKFSNNMYTRTFGITKSFIEYTCINCFFIYIYSVFSLQV